MRFEMHQFISLNFLLFFLCVFGHTDAQEATAIEASDSLGKYYFDQAIAYYSKDQDTTLHLLEKSIVHYQTASDWDGIVLCQAAFSSLAGYAGHYLEYDSLTDLALELTQKHLDETSEVYWSVINNHAFKLKEKGDLDQAIAFFRQVIQHDRNSGDALSLASSILNLGDCYYNKGDFDEALKYRKEARQYRLDTLGEDWRIAMSNISIGDCFRQKNKNDDALKWYEDAVRVLNVERKKTGDSEIVLRSLANGLFKISELMLAQKKWSEAKEKIAAANAFSQTVYVRNQGRGQALLGDLYRAEGDFTKALKCYKRSKAQVQKEFKVFEKHPLIADKDLKIAELYHTQKEWPLALEYYQKALSQLTYDFDEMDVMQNPEPKNVYAKLNALKALQGKAEAFHQLFKQSKKEAHLTLAYETFQLALELIGLLRQDYLSEESKQLLSSRVLPLFEGTIDVAMEWHLQTGEQKYLEEAFIFAESNKAILLLESINESAAKNFAGIPDSLLEKERSLSLEMAHIEKLINEEKQQGVLGEQKEIGSLERELFELNASYQILIQTFEEDYPLYFQLKYEIQLAGVQKVQQELLNNNKALIEFFVGDRSIYVFTILANEVQVNRVEKNDAFSESIQRLRQLISRAPNQTNTAAEFKQYVKDAQLLYQQLIAPSQLKGLDELIIVPDDILAYLPFELLLTETPAASANHYALSQLAYFFEEYTIHYSYSSALLLNTVDQKTALASNNFAGFAPSFQDAEIANSKRDCNAETLYSLQCSQQEVEQIHDLLGGEIWLGKKAVKSTFKATAPNSKILHLATHACIDEQNPQFNKIYFADDYLSNNDLYNLLFQSELAVLSACNTGSGQLVRGEGVMSLSRGFMHAGCPSVVMSLWAVDDCATSNIMVDFYRALKTNQSKPRALQQAKLNFLSKAKKDRQHPYYWAAFVQFGKSAPIDLLPNNFFQSSKLKFLLVGFGLLFLLGGYFSTRSK